MLMDEVTPDEFESDMDELEEDFPEEDSEETSLDGYDED